jgi:hypothetical protein
VSILPPLVEYKIFNPSNVFDHFNVKCIDLIHAGIVSKGYMNLLIVEQKYVEKKVIEWLLSFSKYEIFNYSATSDR